MRGRMSRMGFGQRTSPPPASAPTAVMARRRRLLGHPVVTSVGYGVALAATSVLVISLANGVVGLRQDVASLEQERAWLGADLARLTVDWQAVSARDAVVQQAQAKLALELPESPAPVLAWTAVEQPPSSARWQRMIRAVADGRDIAVAQASPARIELP